MSTPRRYGTQTYVGAAVILMGLGFVGAQLLAPAPSTANSTQAALTRPTPRIIEINTKREDVAKRDNGNQAEAAKPAALLAEPVPPPAPQFAEPGPTQGPPPVSAEELKRRAQEEADQQTAEIPQEAINPPPKRTHSRQRYPRYDRHAVY